LGCRGWLIAWEVSLPVRVYQEGALARIYDYERTSGRCPASDFLDSLDIKLVKKFKGSFLAVLNIGSIYCNGERFKPLQGDGKPLWEFKEHDHRLYCFRAVVQPGKFVVIVLFNGWVKEKRGRTEKENREIAKAISLYNEFLHEYPGGKV
jgi:hypothetical protein